MDRAVLDMKKSLTDFKAEYLAVRSISELRSPHREIFVCVS